MKRCVLLLALMAAALPAGAASLRGEVIVVIDGDTVLVKPEHVDPSGRAFLKVRLADIDAPEKDQPDGEAATRALAALVLHQPVELETRATDVYGRTLARLYVGGVDVETTLVRQGIVWASGYRPVATLQALQQQAREARLGLWQAPDPVPPWVWRRAHPSTWDSAVSR